jgi:hypothetical protein
MFANAIMFFINGLFSLLTPERIKGFIDAGLDSLQAYCESTATQMDDDLVLPAIDLLRSQIEGENAEVNVTTALKNLFDALGKYKTIFLDASLDYVEDYFEQGSQADIIAEKACSIIRVVLHIPDNDDLAFEEEEDDV